MSLEIWRRARCLLVILLSALLISCGDPSTTDVRDDLINAVKREVGGVTSVGGANVHRGEGDSDSVYFVADLTIIADKDVLVDRGALSGVQLRQRQPVEVKHVNALYQRISDGKWRFVSYSIGSSSAHGSIKAAYFQSDTTGKADGLRLRWRWENSDAFGDNPPEEDPDGDGKAFVSTAIQN